MAWGRAARVAFIVAALIAAGCDDKSRTVPRAPDQTAGTEVPTEGTEVPNVVEGEPVTTDTNPPPATSGAVLPPATGVGTAVVVDAGTPFVPDAGPWPLDPVKDYSAAFSVGTPQSASFDEGLNLWLLDGNRIGILRPGDTAPKWTTGVGQAKNGFGLDTLATGSTVICGGEDGRAYVGYATPELQKTDPNVQRAYIPWPGEPYYTEAKFNEYFKGDMDAVRASPDGTVTLEEHLWRTVGDSNKNRQVGIHNTNDFHWEEDRSIRACERVTRGPHRGDVYITTNHGVTMIKGLTYNSHRHPGWYKQYTLPDGTVADALQCTDMNGLGIAQNGDVLVANEQMVGALTPNGVLADWDRENTFNGPVPWAFKFFNHALNDQESWDYWRAFQQVVSGKYYLGSREYGLWELTVVNRSTGQWKKFAGLPTERITALRATDDGALYIGTEDAGLWQLEKDGTTVARVTTVPGNHVRQIGYEPAVTPSMVLVVTNAGVTVLRGP